MQFNIEPHEITATATRLFFEITGSNETHARIAYKLFTADGKIAEESTKDLPLAALSILTPPINVNELNVILAQFNVVATSQITPE